MFLKQFGKEFLIVFILTLAIGFALNMIPYGNATKELIFAPTAMAVGMLVLLYPIIPGAVGGFLVAKKTQALRSILLTPAIATAMAGVVLISFSMVQLYTLDESGWQRELNKVEKIGIGFLADMSLEQFKALTLYSLWFGLVFIGILNFAVGLVGALIGSFFSSKKQRTTVKRQGKKLV